MRSKRTVDYGLYLVTDRGLSRGRSNLEIVTLAVAGGAAVVQLRDKHATTREFLAEAQAIKAFCRQHDVLFIINDRVDVALIVEADGVHLGQDDMPLKFARQVLGKDRIIGLSVFDEIEAREAENAGASYIGVSPIFVTATKPELQKAVGLEGLGRIRRAVKIPLIGIGGLNQTNAYDVIKTGADGIAVVSSICSAADPQKAAQEIQSEIMRARKEQK